MALSVKCGSFVAPTVAGNTTVVTGLGFQPKALICIATIKATSGGFAATSGSSFGFSSGPTASRNTGINVDDNVATTDTSRHWGDGIVGIPTTAGGVLLWYASVASFDANGFTLNWGTVQATGIVVEWMALGGADLTNAECGDFVTLGATGAQTVATGFQPDCILFLGAAYGGPAGGAGVSGIQALRQIGAAKSSTARWSLASAASDAISMTTTMGTKKRQSTTLAYTALGSTGIQGGQFDLTSFNTGPTGFTINWSTAAGWSVAYLALKGGQYAVGAFNKTTGAATAVQDVATPGIAPAGVLLASWGEATSASILADSEQSVGLSDGTSEGSMWQQNKDALLPTEANVDVSTTKGYLAAEGPTTVESEANVSMRPEGFRLSLTTNLTTKAEEICYVAFGNVPSLPPSGYRVLQAVRRAATW